MSNKKYGRLLNKLQDALLDKKASPDLVKGLKDKIAKLENEIHRKK